MKPLAHALIIVGFALLSAVPGVADPPRYVPQVGSQVDDLRLGPHGDLVVTFSSWAVTRVWTGGQLRHVLPGHVAAISRDGRWIATGTQFQGRLGKVRVFSADNGSLRFERDVGHTRVVDFSPDGRYVVAGGLDGRVHLWDLSNGELLHRWELDPQLLTSVAVSPNHEFVTASAERGARVWDLESGKLRFEIDQHDSFVRTCQISPDSARIVTASQDNTVRIYDSRRGDTLAVLHHGPDMLATALSPDGRKVVTAGGGTLQIWNAETGTREHSIEVDKVTSLAIAPDSRSVVVGSSNRVAPTFDLQTGERSGDFTAGSFASRVHFSGDGRVLAVGNSSFGLYDVSSRALLLKLPGCSSPLRDLEFSPDGRFLLGSRASYGVAVWDLAGEGAPFRTDGSMGSWTGRQALFLAGGKCCGGGFRLWDAAARRLVAELKDREPLVLAGGSPDGSVLATSSETGGTRLWSGTTGRALAELSSPASRPFALNLPAPDLVAVGYDHGSVWVWKDGEPEPWRRVHHERGGSVRFLRSSADHRFLVSAATNGRQLLVWDLAGNHHRALPGPSGAGLKDVALAPDGSKLFVAWSKQDIVAWNPETGDMRRVPAGPGERTSLAVSADGRWLASGDTSGEIGLWEAGETAPRIFRVRSAPVSKVAIDPRGRWLAGADSDGTTILWDLATSDELVRLVALADGAWAVVTPDGRWDAANQGRVSGLVAWDRGRATLLANVPQYRSRGLLREVMAPWRSAGVEALAASEPAGERSSGGPTTRLGTRGREDER